jgi:long-subunit fatty acid transport protein
LKAHVVAGILFFAAAAAPLAAQDQQLGARTKAMGGSYTAFQDDPLLVWLNPAGIATQPDQLSVAYQTYTAYPKKESRGPGGTTDFSVRGETILPSPAIIPSYIGFVVQVGEPDNPWAIGAGFARPYNLNYSMDEILTPGQTVFDPRFEVAESLYRFRVAGAHDFRFRSAAEAGFLTHLSVGVGLDLGYEEWRFSSPAGDPRGERRGSAMAPGFGGGILLGLYEDRESFSLHFGAAYQSAVKFDFDVDPDLEPAFDMPQQVNVGLTLYLHQGLPLRVTFDVQWIDWSATAEDPLAAGQPKFRDSLNYSVGLEYRIELSSKTLLYPRLGYRRFAAPWKDRNDLPATGGFKLVLDTKHEEFHIVTFGAGISWTTKESKVRSFDVAAEVGGDSWTAAVGYTHEF